jgi:type VI secretion system secreted protein VgrG
MSTAQAGDLDFVDDPHGRLRERDGWHRSTTPPPGEPLAILGDPGEPLALWAVALPASARLIGFRGSERLSSPYRFEILLTARSDAAIDMQAVLGSRVAIAVAQETGEAALHHGVLAAIELLEASSERFIYRAVMVPELWHLDHSVHSRIFTDVSLPEILAAVLRAGGIDFELQLVEAYQSLEHICQYRESDLAFISRLMERDGLYYFFEQRDDHERLVITDAAETHPAGPAGPVRFLSWAQADERTPQEGLHRFRCRVHALPAQIRLDDYDPLRPSLALRGEASVSRGRGDVVLYGEHLSSPGHGERLARIRAEELRARQAICEGEGTQLGLRSGHSFELEEHPHRAFNRRYLVTEIDHVGRLTTDAMVSELLGSEVETSYRVELRAMPAEVPFRAERVTPWPRIDGVVDGVVDGGSESAYAQLDDHGRYKVRIFFDEGDTVDGSGSTWVRMLQPHGGGIEGMHFPLRKGTEVHMVFLGGHPDRPVIVGTAPNAHNPSTVTAGNYSQNLLRSGGNNQLLMEDSGGGEFVNMSTPHQGSFLHMGAGADNFVSSTGGNGREHVGGNRAGFVGGTFDETVSGAVTQSFAATFDHAVAGPVTQNFAATFSQTVAGAVEITHSATQAVSVGAAASHAYAADLEVTIGGALSQTTTGAASLSYQATVEETIDGAYALTVNAVTSEVHNASKDTTINGSHNLSATGAQLLEGLAAQTIHGGTQQIESDGLQQLSSTTHIVEAATATTQAGTISLEAGGSATVVAGNVGISAGTVAVSGGAVTIDGGGIQVTAGGVVEIGAALIRLN